MATTKRRKGGKKKLSQVFYTTTVLCKYENRFVQFLPGATELTGRIRFPNMVLICGSFFFSVWGIVRVILCAHTGTESSMKGQQHL